MFVKKDVMKLIIRFALMEKECYPMIEQSVGKDIYDELYECYVNDYKRFVHRYIAISNTYHSLVNSANLFLINIKLYEKGVYMVQKEDKEKLFMAINETFLQQLFIQYSKLNETLWRYDFTHKNENVQKAHKEELNIFIEKNGLKDAYAPVHELLIRINNAEIKYLRDKIFAHPFLDDKKKTAISLSSVSEFTYSSLKVLIDESHHLELKNSNHRLKFYAEKYLINGKRTSKHLRSIYDFMNSLKNKTFLGVEPYLYLPPEKAKENITNCLSVIKN